MAHYILRNISKSDINLGDLRYKIPAGKARDLLSKSARLDWEDVKKSIKSGSISKRLGKTLVEIQAINEPIIPRKVAMDPSMVTFPTRVKSTIILEVNDISEDIRKISLIDEDEFLKELDIDEGKAPLIAEDEKDEEKKEPETEG